MTINRRKFVKASAATSALFFTSMTNFLADDSPNVVNNSGACNVQFEKLIKASFGAGFCVLTQVQKAGNTYAEIEHAGNHYTVVSSDLVAWKILSSDVS